jgi:hypothetical protein
MEKATFGTSFVITPNKNFFFAVEEYLGTSAPVDIVEVSSSEEAFNDYGDKLIQIITVVAPSNKSRNAIIRDLWKELGKDRKFNQEIFHWEDRGTSQNREECERLARAHKLKFPKTRVTVVDTNGKVVLEV